MFRVYGTSTSGNCHKVRMALEALGLPYEWTETDSVHGQTRTPDFLAKNPNGKVPVLEIEPGVFLPESMPFFAISPRTRRSCRRTGCSVRECCSGCFSNNIATNLYAVARFLRRFHRIRRHSAHWRKAKATADIARWR